MLYENLFYVFAINIILYLLFHKKFVKIILKNNLIDRPGINKIHKKIVPVTGGILIFLSVINYLLYSLFFLGTENSIIDKTVFILIFGSSFIFLIGLIDDILHIKPQNKLIFITLFIFMFFQNIEFFRIETIIFDNFIIKQNISVISFSIFLSVLSFLAYHYSLVIMDGINGLFGSYIFSLLVLLILFFDFDERVRYFLIYMTLVIFFITILNLNNKLFFGNSGSLMVGALLPFLLLYIYNLRENTFSIITFISLALVPVMDMIRLFFSRIFKKKSPFSKDLNHFHHMLYNKYSLTVTLAIYLSLSFMPFMLIGGLNFDPYLTLILQIILIVITYLSISKKKQSK